MPEPPPENLIILDFTEFFSLFSFSMLKSSFDLKKHANASLLYAYACRLELDLNCFVLNFYLFFKQFYVPIGLNLAYRIIMNNENFPHTFQKMAGQETKTSIPVA